jgi:aspartyl/asparaginyl beta-hydroxylase (cupin superfamily)
MEKNRTKLLQVLDSFGTSLEELKLNSHLFTLHNPTEDYGKNGPLRECSTLHITGDKSFNVLDNEKQTDQTVTLNPELKETENLVNSIKKILDPYDLRPLGRVYITSLPSGGKIYKHSDTSKTKKYWNNIDRYQFYYTGSDDAVQIIDGTRFAMAPGYLYLFDHSKEHEYENNSNEDLILLVIDLFKPGVQ